jgi:hypothetical protein
MKQVFFILLLFISLQSFSQSVKVPEIGLEVYNEDLGKMTWDVATKNVKELGEGWRLPTKEELENKLYPNKSKISNLKDDYYWSSSVGDNGTAWSFTFNREYAYDDYYRKETTAYVRAVRTLK